MEEENIQSIRKALVESQLVVLELQDLVLQRETDKADAVALLGQTELLLEEKIDHIMRLDHALNERIRTLESEVSTARQAAHTVTLQRDDLQAAVNDLVSRLDQANQEIGRAHELAGDYATKLTACHEEKSRLQQVVSSLQQTVTEKTDDLQARDTQLKDLGEAAAQQQNLLDASRASCADLRHTVTQLDARLETVQSSWLWRSTAWLRRWFGPHLS